MILTIGTLLTACTEESTTEDVDITKSLLEDFVNNQLIFTNDISEKLGSQKNINFNATRSATTIHYDHASLSSELQLANVETPDLVAKMIIVMQKRVNSFLKEFSKSNTTITEEEIKSIITDEIANQMEVKKNSKLSKDCGIDLDEATYSCETNYAVSLVENAIENFYTNGAGTFIGIVKVGSLYVSCGTEAMSIFRSCEGK